MADKSQASLNEPRSRVVKRDIVLIPVDGSEFSEYAIEFYLTTIHKPENHVVFLHSTEYKSISSPDVFKMDQFSDSFQGVAMGGSPFNFTETIKAEEDKAKVLIKRLEARMKEKNIDGEVYHVHGEAGPGIITSANEKHVDYIVIGCRGKGTVRRTLTGSVTDYVTHHAKIPVIVARHRDHIHHHHHGHHLPSHLKH